MPLSTERQNAYDTLRQIITQENIPQMQKTTAQQLHNMGIQNSLIGAELMRKNLNKLMNKLSLYGGQLSEQQATANELATARKEQNLYNTSERLASQKWQQTIRDEQRAYEKSLESSKAKAAKNKMWQGILLQLGLLGVSAGAGALTPGVGALKGMLLGLPGQATRVGQQIGMQDLIKLMQTQSITPNIVGSGSPLDISQLGTAGETQYPNILNLNNSYY